MRLRVLFLALALTGCGTPPAPRGTARAWPSPSAAPAVVPQAPEVRVLASESPTETRRATAEQTAPPEAPTPPAFREPLVARSETRAIVLLYHAFNRGAVPLSVRTPHFDEQLDWLQNNHVEIVSTSELVRFLSGEIRLPRRVAVITIDDGLDSVYIHAWPILERRRVKFTIGLPTGMLEHPRNAPVMTWDQVREMVRSGLCEVASHGHMHRRLPNLSGIKRHEEIELSRDLITERLGRPPVAYFYPLGAFDPVSAKALSRAGYPAAFRASGAPIAAGSGSSFWLPRVSVFHDETYVRVSNYFGEKYLAQVRYGAARDPGAEVEPAATGR